MSEEAGFVTGVTGCARCGEDHEGIRFRVLGRPIGDYTHWAPCPETGEPIILTTNGPPGGSVPLPGEFQLGSREHQAALDAAEREWLSTQEQGVEDGRCPLCGTETTTVVLDGRPGEPEVEGCPNCGWDAMPWPEGWGDVDWPSVDNETLAARLRSIGSHPRVEPRATEQDIAVAREAATRLATDPPREPLSIRDLCMGRDDEGALCCRRAGHDGLCRFGPPREPNVTCPDCGTALAARWLTQDDPPRDEPDGEACPMGPHDGERWPCEACGWVPDSEGREPEARRIIAELVDIMPQNVHGSEYKATVMRRARAYLAGTPPAKDREAWRPWPPPEHGFDAVQVGWDNDPTEQGVLYQTADREWIDSHGMKAAEFTDPPTHWQPLPTPPPPEGESER